MKKVFYILGLFLLVGYVGAQECPKIEVDAVSKKITVIPCDSADAASGSVSDEKEESSPVATTGDATDVSVNIPEESSETGTVETGSFTRISEEGACPQIFANDTTKKIKVIECGDTLEGNINELESEKDSVKKNDTVTETKNIETGSVTPDEPTSPVSNLSEFEQALQWMYSNGLTKYNTKDEYRPRDPLLREEAAKMFGRAYQVFGYDVKAMKNNQCEFSDEQDFNLELVRHITDVCHWGLFKGTDDGRFMPKHSLKKSEATAVLVRMLEGKISYEGNTPRWTDYYQKAFLLGITTIDNINIYDKVQNREEIALMLWRFKKIMENKNKDSWLDALAEADSNSSSGLNLDNWETDLDKVLGEVDFKKDPELLEAINWMHDKGLTSFSDVEKYAPQEVLTRGQAAKIFDIFGTALGVKEKESFLPNECVFSDIAGLPQSNILHIQNVCKKGIIKGGNGKFSPDEPMLKSQFMVILVRLFDGKNVQSDTTPRWKGYFEKARELGLVDISDIMNFEKPIRRYEVALFLYRFNVRYNIVNNINSTSVDKQLITTIEKTKVVKDKKVNIDAYVDMSLFSMNDLDIAYLYLLDTRYKIVKTLRREYVDDAYVWYGDIFDLIDNKKLGTVNLIIRNNKLISGILRVDTKNYILEKKEGVEAYFTVIEQ